MGNQFFDVPNNDEGREFLRLARKFAHHPLSVWTRGRGKNRLARYEQYCLVKYGKPNYGSKKNAQCAVVKDCADSFAVYLRRKVGHRTLTCRPCDYVAPT